MHNKFKTLIFALLSVILVNAQEVLSKSDAVALALENNYGIKIANTSVEIAENNTSILNSGYLPVISTVAGANYSVNNTETEFSDGSSTTLKAAETSRYNASINLDYTLFDGLGRHYNYKRLKEQYQLSELQARETIENTIVLLFSVYYNVAQLTENVQSLEQSLDISKDRVLRAQYQFDYGQNTKLGVLNAQVDINTDSIALINFRQQLINAKRDLNLVLGNTVSSDFNVETIVEFLIGLKKDELLSKIKMNNVSLLQMEKNISISELNVKGNTSGYLPTVGLTGSYGWNENNNNAASFARKSDNFGLNAGVNLRWNIFDGGATKTRLRNSKLDLEAQKLQKEQIILSVERDFYNAWDDYQNRLTIYKVQEENIVTSQNNFDRTQEKFKLGQASSIEFRQAQLNLLQAEVNRNQAKYDAKFAELIVLQLSGELLNLDF